MRGICRDQLDPNQAHGKISTAAAAPIIWSQNGWCLNTLKSPRRFSTLLGGQTQLIEEVDTVATYAPAREAARNESHGKASAARFRATAMRAQCGAQSPSESLMSSASAISAAISC